MVNSCLLGTLIPAAMAPWSIAMTSEETVNERLYRVFADAFVVRDIAEALVSFDAGASSADTRQLMDQRAYRIIGIRHDGLVQGFARREELTQGTCGEVMHRIQREDVISEWAGLSEAIPLLTDRKQLFVTCFGQIGGIVTRTDLQKPPVRMWLFGMVTIIEMSFSRLIVNHLGENWTDALSEGRLARATELQLERQRRNQDPELVDCLQFSDKAQLVLKSAELRERLEFNSRREGEQVFKALEALRNNLAHAQDIVTHDWETIVRLADNVERVIAVAH